MVITRVFFMLMEITRVTTTNYKSDKSIFAHGGDSEKTQRSSKSAATELIKFESELIKFESNHRTDHGKNGATRSILFMNFG